MASLADRIDALLPQTQCRQCGYPGCRPYAEALAADRADINCCPPGGSGTLRALAELTGRPAVPLQGVHKPPAVARIDEPACIGCTLCIQACPVDAIVGTVNAMHTVIGAECTGCELCVPACPVDCIAMIETGALVTRGESLEQAARYRQRFLAREARLEREREARSQAARARASEQRKRTTIARVIERARRRLRQR